MKSVLKIALVLALLTGPAQAQEFTFDDFVGIWDGHYTSETFGGNEFDLTLVAYANGFYTDSSGYFMPPYYYPDTQQWEFDAATNRLHFWYLDTVYGGQYFYQHFFYEVVSYTGNTLVLHYNFWDDPEPHPAVGTLVLNRMGTSAVGDGDAPARAELSGNYPNPFNPSTSIEFSLPQDDFVTLKIFDVRGREVSTLVANRLSAGTHSYRWDASGMADGVYLYQLTTGNFRETRKMTLVK